MRAIAKTDKIPQCSSMVANKLAVARPSGVEVLPYLCTLRRQSIAIQRRRSYHCLGELV